MPPQTMAPKAEVSTMAQTRTAPSAGIPMSRVGSTESITSTAPRTSKTASKDKPRKYVVPTAPPSLCPSARLMM